MNKISYILTIGILFFILSSTLVLAEDLPAEPTMTGRVEGTGTYFEITDSEYLNITLESSESIGLMLESIPETITMKITPVSESTSTQITLSGLQPSTTYYKYEDDYNNLNNLTTDETGHVMFTHDLSKEHLIFIQTNPSTIYLYDNGLNCNLYLGTWYSSSKTCRMTKDVTQTIQIGSNGITLDGNGHTISGSNSGNGVYAPSVSGVTIKNLYIKTFSYGIRLYNANNYQIYNNWLRDGYGVYLDNSNSGSIYSNTFDGCNRGIYLSNSNYSSIYNNNMPRIVWDYGIYLSNSNNLTINNNNIYIFMNVRPYGIYLVNSSNDSIYNNTLGTEQTYQTNYGIYLLNSGNNYVYNNNLNYYVYGVYLSKSNNSYIYNNNINSPHYYYQTYGIYLDNSNYESIYYNDLTSNDLGIYVFYSNYNFLHHNSIQYSGYYGIYLTNSNNNYINNNELMQNWYGLYIYFNSKGNLIFNNNFISNIVGYQARDLSGGNYWNTSKPDGGNYWSNFDTPSEGCSDLDNDGFCDNPYVFDSRDYLPHVCPIGLAPPDTTPPVTSLSLSGTLGTNDWYVSDVSVTLTATDTGGSCGSGGAVASTKYSFDNINWFTYTDSLTLSSDGTTTIYYYSIDTAGNMEESKTQTIKIDETMPIVTGSRAPEPNVNGWNNADVTVHFDCVDETSGVYSVIEDQTIRTEGALQSVTGTCVDNAGNSVDSTVPNINIDKTLPTITIITPQPYGLYTIGTSLNFSASDSLSGLASVFGELTSTDGGTVIVNDGFLPEPGVYTLVVKATDNAGNLAVSNQVFFVVYDPNGGFATGGGWIIPDSESTLPGGIANFGFVAKYKSGSSTGNLEFQYQYASINLKSTSINWLSISGSCAQFQGTGTINGQGTYTFRVSVKDYGEPGVNLDLFDIKIWEGTNTDAPFIHRSKSLLSGGNIVIHKK